MFDVIIVGAGFAGSVCARELADSGMNVLIIDKRDHVGGNAFDTFDSQGVQIHPYGPHIFHTNSKRIFDWLSRFTGWRFYEHRVLASARGQLLPIPINLNTINRLYDFNLDSEGVAQWLEKVREPLTEIRTSEDVVLSSVGRDLCDLFFRGYTLKQWGLDLSQLSAGVAARIPTRTGTDDRYFTDTYQFMPDPGYSSLFNNMLNHPNIKIELQTDYFAVRESLSAKHIVYTGPIDAFFDYRFGRLPYRSLRFEHEHIPALEHYQTCGTINYPNEFEFTRITEFKHLTGQSHSGTSIVKEYPQDDGDPYYPVPRPENDLLYRRYHELAREQQNVTFVGRLAQYKYYNMDQVVGAALSKVEDILSRCR